MRFRTITFTVQLGSEGHQVASLVAEKLGYRYYDWQVTAEAAKEAGVPSETMLSTERVPSLVNRVVERFLAGGPSPSDIDGLPSAETMSSAIRALTSEDYRYFVEAVVMRLGEEGNAAIVGHASQVLLRGKSDVFRVLICGGEVSRTEKLAKREGSTLKQALKQIKQSDRERLNFFDHYYHVNLLDPALYDLCLNTDTYSIEAARDLVAAALLPASS